MDYVENQLLTDWFVVELECVLSLPSRDHFHGGRVSGDEEGEVSNGFVAAEGVGHAGRGRDGQTARGARVELTKN